MDIYGRGGRGGGGRGGGRSRGGMSRSRSSGRTRVARGNIGSGLSSGLSSMATSRMMGGGLLGGSSSSSLLSDQTDMSSIGLGNRLGQDHSSGWEGLGGPPGRGGGSIPPGMRPDLGGGEGPAPWSEPYYEEPMPEEMVDEEGVPLDIEQIGEMVASEFAGFDNDFDDDDGLDTFGYMPTGPARMSRIEGLAKLALSGSQASGREMIGEIQKDLATDGEARITTPVFKAIRKHYTSGAVFPRPFSRRITGSAPSQRVASTYGQDPSWQDGSCKPGTSSTFVDGLKVGAGVTAGVVGALAVIGLVARAVTS